MKRYFIALFILPLLLVACDDDKLEMMPPYIFFNYDVDTYVMDIDNPNLADFTVKGSISAQGSFSSFVMGDQELGKEELGDSLNRPFEYIVPLKGKTADFDVPFVLTDRMGNTVTKPFHFLASKPIESYQVSMGAQYNPYLGFFFSFEDQKVYSVSEMMKMPNPDGFCFGYNINKKQPMFVSPTELINQTVLSDYKGNRIASFVGVVAVDGVNFTKEVFDNMKNDALMCNLNPIEYGTFTNVVISEGKAYLFKNEDDSLRGIIFVQSLESGVSGQVQLAIKMQKVN
ncbi:hypothetical protein [Bacteroides sp.]|jgi:hypothetical protein|uniref:hypothetical protein n=1 Tax=Bacteroides sp. TaxID=29523 RepID=UPI00258D0600|nr:hypothetical protein [Bacteroides sp.]